MPTLRVALTGGIATGKSFCLAQFAEDGVPVIDADRLAHDAIAPGAPGYDAAVARFGAAIVGADGAINRAVLAGIVFGDDRARRDLEAIIHPGVYRAIERWFAELGDRGEPMGIADIPLLYETGREIDFDAVVVAACPAPLQIARLKERNGLTASEARQRLAAQMPIDEKTDRADHVIDTSGSFVETMTQCRAVVAALRRDAQDAR
jgi:dephospho-CoA kinase